MNGADISAPMEDDSFRKCSSRLWRSSKKPSSISAATRDSETNSTAFAITPGGRLLYFAPNLSRAGGGCRIYLKMEGLAHTGAHKINNVLGQSLLARKMGKARLVAGTGAGHTDWPSRPRPPGSA